jgi:hypothetical protein
MVPGDVLEDFSCTVSLDLTRVQRVYLPIWLGQHRYRGGAYQYGGDGARSFRIYGDRPVDQSRKERIALLFRPYRWWRAAYVVIALASVAWLLIGDTPEAGPAAIWAILLGWVPAAVAYLTATARRGAIIQRSRAVRARALAGLRGRT